MRQLIESSGFIAVWILRCEDLAVGVGSGDDNGTMGIVDCVVIATNTVAGGFESAEECFGFGEHSRVITFSALGLFGLWISLLTASLRLLP